MESDNKQDQRLTTESSHRQVISGLWQGTVCGLFLLLADAFTLTDPGSGVGFMIGSVIIIWLVFTAFFAPNHKHKRKFNFTFCACIIACYVATHVAKHHQDQANLKQGLQLAQQAHYHIKEHHACPPTSFKLQLPQGFWLSCRDQHLDRASINWSSLWRSTHGTCVITEQQCFFTPRWRL